MAKGHVALTCILALLVVFVAGCAVQLPRAWREYVYGPDATPTPMVVRTPTRPPVVHTPTSVPSPTFTWPPSPTAAPTQTLLPTRTATATPSLATLTLQQGLPWYSCGRSVPYEGVEDTHISEWARSVNFADAPVLSVRQGDVMAALIYFNLGLLPTNLPVQRAELHVYVGARSNDTPMIVKLRPVLKPWMLHEATWQMARNGLPWQIAGAKGETDRLDPLDEAVADRRGAWLSFEITALVQAWLASPQDNQGVLISGEAASAVQYDLVSSDSRDAEHRPRLTITFPTGALAIEPAKTVSPTPSSTATVNPSRPEVVPLERLLPRGSVVLGRAAGDLNADGLAEIVAVYRLASDSGLRLGVFQRYADSGPQADYRLTWNSRELFADRLAGLELMDLTGDGKPEILCTGATLTGLRMLYLFTAQPLGYRLLSPVGGFFNGRDHFGEAGYDLADSNGDGRLEILARHNGQLDVYAWDGVNFTRSGP